MCGTSWQAESLRQQIELLGCFEMSRSLKCGFSSVLLAVFQQAESQGGDSSGAILAGIPFGLDSFIWRARQGEREGGPGGIGSQRTSPYLCGVPQRATKDTHMPLAS